MGNKLHDWAEQILRREVELLIHSISVIAIVYLRIPFKNNGHDSKMIDAIARNTISKKWEFYVTKQHVKLLYG